MTADEEIYYRNCITDFGLVPPNAKVDVFNITTTIGFVTASSSINASSPCFVYKNGKLLRYTTDYTISNPVVLFTTNLVNGDIVVIIYTV